jgi:hypothetical protein
MRHFHILTSIFQDVLRNLLFGFYSHYLNFSKYDRKAFLPVISVHKQQERQWLLKLKCLFDNT